MPDNNSANLPIISALNAINAKKPSTNGRRAAAFNLNSNNNGNKSFLVFLPFPRAENGIKSKTNFFFGLVKLIRQQNVNSIKNMFHVICMRWKKRTKIYSTIITFIDGTRSPNAFSMPFNFVGVSKVVRLKIKFHRKHRYHFTRIRTHKVEIKMNRASIRITNYCHIHVCV